MGSQLDIFIGPYIVVTGTKKVVLDKTANTCSNNNCETYKINQNYSAKQNFCAECGSAVEIKKYKEEKFLDAQNLYLKSNEHDDTLVHVEGKGDMHVFIGNHYSPFDFRKRTNEGSFAGVDLRDAKHEEEIEWFKDYYKGVLDFFKKELGKDSIEYKWGFVQWYD